MINSKAEREAVHRTALVMNGFGWIFREQPVSDIGIDAFVELRLNNNKVRFLALQIKGGKSNFYRKGAKITFYFSERHYAYWQAVSETKMVLLILYDPEISTLYWAPFDSKTAIETGKGWKVELNTSNTLEIDAKAKIENLAQLYNQPTFQETIPTSDSGLNLPSPQKLINLSTKSKKINFKYLLNEKGNLLCIIRKGKQNLSVDLEYIPRDIIGNQKEVKLAFDDPHFWTLEGFENRLMKLAKNKNSGSSLDALLGGGLYSALYGGIRKLAEYLFDQENIDTGVPKFKEFIDGFEHYSKLSPKEYEIEILGVVMLFHTKDNIYEVNTYPGLTSSLRDFINGRSYDEIGSQTEEWIWNHIYIDAGIEKAHFIPVLLNEWELYWDKIYTRIQAEIGKTIHLDLLKEKSERKLRHFTDLYNETGDIIKLAADLDHELYPLAVITMLRIFNAEVCYGEYCELEFFTSQNWETIDYDDYYTSDREILFIRPYENY